MLQIGNKSGLQTSTRAYVNMFVCMFCIQAVWLPCTLQRWLREVERRARVTQRPFSEISPFLWSHRYLQFRVWMAPPDSWGLPSLQQARGRTRGNEYQPSNIKRKHKHGWVRRLSTPAGVQVILRRMLKGRKSLSH